METIHILRSNLKSLKMPGIMENLDIRLQQASETKMSYLDFLSLLIQDERSQRDSNQINKLLRQAGFGQERTFEGFDFSFNKNDFPERVIHDLGTCSFIDFGKNVVIAGPPGIGKTHIAKAIGHEACRRKKHVVYKNIYDLFSELRRARTDQHYERLIKKNIRCDLLILDDFALRKFTQEEIDILYSIVDSRHDYKSVILTSNRPPEDWIGVFPDMVVGGAILDRLVSGAIKIIVKNAKSFRKEGKKKEVNADN